MGLLHKGITILHFDETYFAQKKLLAYPHEDINLQPLKHVNLYCEKESLTILKKKLNSRRQRGITYIGSGNYHYITYLLLREMTQPTTLVLFDHHPDLGTDTELLSCGSWVSYALTEIPLLHKVVIIGPTSQTIHPACQHPRVVLFPLDGSQIYSMKTILSTIQTKSIYISIDKDVLTPREAMTNWDQGNMHLQTLLTYLQMLLKYKQVEGVDVCGEIRPTPRFLFQPELQAMIQKNETANLKIRQTCLQIDDPHSIGA